MERSVVRLEDDESKDALPSHNTEDTLLANWNDRCSDMPSGISLEERMNRLGLLLGEEGRRFVVYSLSSSFGNAGDATDAFRNDFRNYATEYLVPSNSNAKRAAHVLTDEPSPKRTQPAELSFTDRCLEWYYKQPNIEAQPSQNVTFLFNCTLDIALATATSMLDFFFQSNAMTISFVEFLKSLSFEGKVKAETLVLEETKAAFRAEYRDDNHAVDDFIGYVDECHTEYQHNSGNYYAPYISLCQSSGYGKSRLLQQVSRQRKLLYICIGDSASSFPKPNPQARNFLFADHHQNEEFRKEHLQRQLERCVCWCLQNDLIGIDQFDEHPPAFWANIATHEVIAASDSKPDQTILIAFDEAGSLLSEPDGSVSDFRILQRALRDVSRIVHHCIFVILVDTTSTIANFSPSKTVDASHRPNIEGRHLFHPYILLLTHDALIKSNKKSNDDFVDEWSFVNCGRPLWKSLYPDLPASRSNMFVYATQKLCKSVKVDTDDELALLAITMCRTGKSSISSGE